MEPALCQLYRHTFVPYSFIDDGRIVCGKRLYVTVGRPSVCLSFESARRKRIVSTRGTTDVQETSDLRQDGAVTEHGAVRQCFEQRVERPRAFRRDSVDHPGEVRVAVPIQPHLRGDTRARPACRRTQRRRKDFKSGGAQWW